MSDQQPQPQKPPMREIEAVSGVWRSPTGPEEADEATDLHPPVEDLSSGYADELLNSHDADALDAPSHEDYGWPPDRYDYSVGPSYPTALDDELDAGYPVTADAGEVLAPEAVDQEETRYSADPARGAVPAADAAPPAGSAARTATSPPAPTDDGARVGRGAPPNGHGPGYGQRPPAVPPMPSGGEWLPDDEDPGSADARAMRIGIWGPPGSGKTTYLAALQHDAASRIQDEIGNWRIIARNDVSEQLLTEWTQLLVAEQQFPEATALGQLTDLRWHFMGDLANSRFVRRRMIRRRTEPLSEFDLELIDVSGEAFGYRPSQAMPASIVQQALAHLARSDGLIFLFDPITERERPSVVTYVQRVLNNLARRMLNEGRMRDGYLPHYVSVCIAKTDDAELTDRARLAGLVNTGRDGIDRVLNDQAEGLFNAICDGGFWEHDDRSNGGAVLVRNQLRQYFHPSRIRYYATSAIGHQNLATRDGVLKINGPIQPYNVLEPLVELYMQLRDRAVR
jgi:hypothetical protein